MRTGRKRIAASDEKPVAEAEPKTPTVIADYDAVVRRRAYEIYRERIGRVGGEDGDAVSDWLRAEREVLRGGS